jgi:hypothetical protein
MADDPNDPLDITDILELKKINEELREVGTRQVTTQEYQAAKDRAKAIEFADPKSKGELVLFGQEQSPPASPERGGIWSALRKVIPIARKRYPALGLADLAVTHMPSEEKMQERIKEIEKESPWPTLRKDPIGHVRSGLETIVDLVKGKNPSISRRDFMKGVKTAGEMALAPNLPLELDPKKDPWKTVEAGITINPLNKEKIITNALKALSTSKIPHLPTIHLSIKPEALQHPAFPSHLIEEIFDFSTETGLYGSSDDPEKDNEDERKWRETTTLDEITELSSLPTFAQAPDWDAQERNPLKGPNRTRLARKGKWEELTDSLDFYDIQKDPEGTWKVYKKIAQEFQKGDKRDKFLLRNDILDAWDEVMHSEKRAKYLIKEFLSDYFKNFKELDDGTFISVNPEERIKMLRDREVAKQERLDKLYPPQPPLSKREKEAMDRIYGEPTIDIKKEQEEYKVKRKAENKQEKERAKKNPELFDIFYEEEIEDDPYNKYSGGVIRNPYSYAPRDI